MKKILFVAIATVAFAGTGFAANEVVEKNINDIGGPWDPLMDGWAYCAIKTIIYESDLKEGGMSEEQAEMLGNAYFSGCMDGFTRANSHICPGNGHC